MNPALSRWFIPVTFSACVSLAGCATAPAPHPWGYVNGSIPATGLASTPRIVADEQAARLSVPTREEKERFKKRRSDNINAQVDRAGVSGYDVARCLISLPCVFGLPIVLPVAHVAAKGELYVKASRMAPPVNSVSEKEASQLALVVEETITAAVLGERVARIAQSTGTPDSKVGEYPQLVIRNKSAQLLYTVRGLVLNIHAEAQALPSPDSSWKPTIHSYVLPYQMLDGLMKKPDEPLRNKMDVILGGLASSIWETYSPKK